MVLSEGTVAIPTIATYYFVLFSIFCLIDAIVLLLKNVIHNVKEI